MQGRGSEPAAVLRIRLTPRAGRDRLSHQEKGDGGESGRDGREEEPVLYARVAAHPVDGAANRALVTLLSEALGIPKSAIAFLSGEAGREKALQISGLEDAELKTRVTAALPQSGQARDTRKRASHRRERMLRGEAVLPESGSNTESQREQ